MEKTEIMKVQLENCEYALESDRLKSGNEDVSFEMLLKEIKSFENEWIEFFNKKVNDLSLTSRLIAKNCDVTEKTVRKWNKSFPKKRQQAVFLGLTLRMTLDEINHALMRYGKQPKLYAKSAEDCIYIFMITSKCYLYPADKFNQMSEIVKELLESDITESEEKKSGTPTGVLNTKLLTVQGIIDFKSYIINHKSDFMEANNKFYDYICSHMEKEDITMNTLVAYEGLRAGFGDDFSRLKNLRKKNAARRNCVPKRGDLIALGIVSKMTVDQINEMLVLAHMEPLCPKDRLEAAIMFILYDIELNFANIYSCYTDEMGMHYLNEDILQYLDYRKKNPVSFIDVGDAEMMNYIKQGTVNIDEELWEDMKKYLSVTLK